MGEDVLPEEGTGFVEPSGGLLGQTVELAGSHPVLTVLADTLICGLYGFFVGLPHPLVGSLPLAEILGGTGAAVGFVLGLLLVRRANEPLPRAAAVPHVTQQGADLAAPSLGATSDSGQKGWHRPSIRWWWYRLQTQQSVQVVAAGGLILVALLLIYLHAPTVIVIVVIAPGGWVWRSAIKRRRIW